MEGVYNHGRGQYSDQASGMGFPAGFTGKPNARNWLRLTTWLPPMQLLLQRSTGRWWFWAVPRRGAQRQ
jgi:hypothetical protein